MTRNAPARPIQTPYAPPPPSSAPPSSPLLSHHTHTEAFGIPINPSSGKCPCAAHARASAGQRIPFPGALPRPRARREPGRAWLCRVISMGNSMDHARNSFLNRPVLAPVCCAAGCPPGFGETRALGPQDQCCSCDARSQIQSPSLILRGRYSSVTYWKPNAESA